MRACSARPLAWRLMWHRLRRRRYRALCWCGRLRSLAHCHALCAQPGAMRRCGGVSWGDGRLALLYESWYKTRRSRVWTIAPDDPAAPPRLLWDRDYEDAYGDPGSPLGRRTALGTYVLAQLEGSGELLLQGACPYPHGRPRGPPTWQIQGPASFRA